MVQRGLLVTSYNITNVCSPSNLELHHQESMYQKLLVSSGCLLEIYRYGFLHAIGEEGPPLFYPKLMLELGSGPHSPHLLGGHDCFLFFPISISLQRKIFPQLVFSSSNHLISFLPFSSLPSCPVPSPPFPSLPLPFSSLPFLFFSTNLTGKIVCFYCFIFLTSHHSLTHYSLDFAA